MMESEYFLHLADSAEFASWLAPVAEVDKLDGARVSEQVKSQSKGKPREQGINDMPSGLLHTHQLAPKQQVHLQTPEHDK